MTSAIDATKPADGVPSVKADLRANLAAARAEILALQAAGGSADSEGITYLAPAIGSVSRTTESKLSDIINIRDFGAVMDGTADDTAALQKAIDHAELVNNGEGRSVIQITGSTLINPAALVTPIVAVTLQINGRLRLSSTLTLTNKLFLVGVGGFSGGVQFQIGPACIVEGIGDIYAVKMYESSYMSGVNFYKTSGSKPPLHIGREPTDPLFLGGRQTFLVRLENVGSYTQGTTCAIRIESTFWLWIRHFAALCDTGPSIWFADSYYPGDANNTCGLIDVSHGVVSGGGIQIGTSGAPASTGYHWWFDQIHHENTSASFIKIGTSSKNIVDLRLTRIGVADPLDALTHAVVDNTVGAYIANVYFNFNMMYTNSPPWHGRPPFGTVDMNGFLAFQYDADYDFFRYSNVKQRFHHGGDVEQQDAYRGGDFAPFALPTDASMIITNQDPNVWSGGSGMSFTYSQTAPDGSPTAIRIQSTAYISKQYFANLTSMTAHWVIYGMWVRAFDQTKRIALQMNALPCNLNFGGIVGGYFNGDTADTTLFRASENPRYTCTYAGWLSIVEAVQVNATTGPDNFIYEIRCQVGSDFVIWKPFAFSLPQSTHSRRDIARIISKLRAIDATTKPGTVSILPHQTLRSGFGATSARPSASTVGAGAQWFDTDIGMPIWSDGGAMVSPLTLRERTITTANTIGAADHGKRILCTSAATHTVSSAATLGAGFECEVVNDSGGSVILDGPGATNVTMADGEVVTLLCTNSKIRVCKGASTVIS